MMREPSRETEPPPRCPGRREQKVLCRAEAQHSDLGGPDDTRLRQAVAEMLGEVSRLLSLSPVIMRCEL